MRWGVLYGSWWMVQWSFDGTLSLGVHIDPCTRQGDDRQYGPYIDFHFLFAAVSLGRQPAAANNHSLMRPLWNART